MIKIGLLSHDSQLQPLLSSALGKGFEIFSMFYYGRVGDLRAANCDVILLDLDSNQKDPQERIALFTRLVGNNEVTSVVLADDALRSTAVDLVKLGAVGLCRRPPSVRELKCLLERAYERSRSERNLPLFPERPTAASGCDGLIGSSPRMGEIYDLVRRVASINVSVLVTGESGTGKELIARAIHNMGGRSDRPFVAVSCGAIPETLIESELFGHEKGAFTGTTGTRIGFFEQAAEGTLFLDEIGELSLSTQVKLLRVLQQREFSRLGSNKLIPLKARLVLATHQDLAEMVAQGKFREDLYYRIDVVRIASPSLHEHPEDIPALARHFMAQYSIIYQKPMTDIEPEALAALKANAWPGNVRELENVIQRAIVIATGDILRADDLPHTMREHNVVSIDEYDPTGSFERQLRSYKVRLAITAVEESGGNKTDAARALQISRAYLHRLLRLGESQLLPGTDLPRESAIQALEMA